MKKYIITSMSLLAVLTPTTAMSKMTITGDALVQENRTNILKVTGNVTAKKDNSILQAEKITYDNNKKDIKASGNVRYILKNQMSIKADALLLKDNGYIKSTNARYTSCKVGSKNISSWEIRAQEIERDVVEKSINLKHATLNIYGYPVYYWPYISQPEPSVIRAKGWMTPNGGTNTTLGAYISNEYYIPLNDTDLSIIPTYSTKGGTTIQIISKHKQLNSSLNVNAAVTRAKQDKPFYYSFINYQKILPNSGWKIGGTLEHSTDDKYTKEYTFLQQTDKDYLKTSLYAEKSLRNSYLNISSTKYQDIRITKGENNYILPQFNYEFQEFSEKLNTFIQNKTVVRTIQVADTGKTSMISNTVQVSSPQYLNNGLVITPSLGVRTDILHYKNKYSTKPTDKKYISGTQQKILPSINLIISYPILATKDAQQNLLEPIAGLYITKNHEQKSYIKNYDSSDFDINESNIFTSNRYAGIDKIDTGNRFAYGLRLKSWLENNTYLQSFLGQSISFSGNKKYSDYIGNFRLEKDSFNVTSNFELDSEAFELRKLEASSNFTYDNSRIGLGLTETNPRDGSQLDPLKQIKTEIEHVFNSNWSVIAKNTANYKKNSGPVSQSLAVSYTTDCSCITTKLTYTKDFSINADTPEESMYFQVIFKSFGEDTDLTNFSVVQKK